MITSKHTCMLCNKNPVRNDYFCEECLNPDTRDKTFDIRLSIIITELKKNNTLGGKNE